MELNNISSTGIWAAIASLLNDNFKKIELEIEKIIYPYSSFKGYFESFSLLQNRCSHPYPGDTAWVGIPYPGYIYDCLVEGSWNKTNNVPEASGVDLNDYVKNEALLPMQVAVNNLAQTMTKLVSLSNMVVEDGFHFVDKTGNDVLNYTEEGLDAAKVADHLISLILRNDSISLKMLSKSLIQQLSSTVLVNEDGFHFADSTGNDVLNYTEEGLDAAKISTHFVNVLNAAGVSGRLEYEIISNEEYNF